MFRTVSILVPAILVAAATTSPACAQETQASAAAKFKREFAASDANHDGVLELAEVQARIGHMKVGPGEPDPTHAKRLAELWFQTADRNHDGKVTEPEAQALLTATFNKYDANRDGKIGTGERATAKQEMGKR